jgi:hypothetical protein
LEPDELLREVVGTLERLQVPYFVTGSTATILYGEPRFTDRAGSSSARMPPALTAAPGPDAPPAQRNAPVSRTSHRPGFGAPTDVASVGRRRRGAPSSQAAAALAPSAASAAPARTGRGA